MPWDYVDLAVNFLMNVFIPFIVIIIIFKRNWDHCKIQNKGIIKVILVQILITDMNFSKVY